MFSDKRPLGVQGCVDSHKNIYYKRLTDASSWDAWSNFMHVWRSSNNKLDTDFKLYGSEADLASDTNAWTYCNYDDTGTCGGVAFPRDCGPTGSVGSQWIGQYDQSCQARKARWYIAVRYDPSKTKDAAFEGNHDQETLRFSRFADQTLPTDQAVRVTPLEWKGHTSMRLALLVGAAGDVASTARNDALNETTTVLPVSTRMLSVADGRSPSLHVEDNSTLVQEYLDSLPEGALDFRGRPTHLPLLQDTDRSNGWNSPERMTDGNDGHGGYVQPAGCGVDGEHYAVFDLGSTGVRVEYVRYYLTNNRRQCSESLWLSRHKDFPGAERDKSTADTRKVFSCSSFDECGTHTGPVGRRFLLSGADGFRYLRIGVGKSDQHTWAIIQAVQVRLVPVTHFPEPQAVVDGPVRPHVRELVVPDIDRNGTLVYMEGREERAREDWRVQTTALDTDAYGDEVERATAPTSWLQKDMLVLVRPGEGCCSACHPTTEVDPSSWRSCHCRAGYERLDAGTGACTKCPKGYVKPEPGGGACTACPKGTYADSDSRSCVLCPGCQSCDGESSPAAAGTADSAAPVVVEQSILLFLFENDYDDVNGIVKLHPDYEQMKSEGHYDAWLELSHETNMSLVKHGEASLIMTPNTNDYIAYYGFFESDPVHRYTEDLLSMEEFTIGFWVRFHRNGPELWPEQFDEVEQEWVNSYHVLVITRDVQTWVNDKKQPYLHVHFQYPQEILSNREPSLFFTMRSGRYEKFEVRVSDGLSRDLETWHHVVWTVSKQDGWKVYIDNVVRDMYQGNDRISSVDTADHEWTDWELQSTHLHIYFHMFIMHHFSISKDDPDGGFSAGGHLDNLQVTNSVFDEQQVALSYEGYVTAAAGGAELTSLLCGPCPSCSAAGDAESECVPGTGSYPDCAECPLGTYNPDPRANQDCLQCPAGAVRPGDGSVCAPGEQRSRSGCVGPDLWYHVDDLNASGTASATWPDRGLLKQDARVPGGGWFAKLAEEGTDLLAATHNDSQASAGRAPIEFGVLDGDAWTACALVKTKGHLRRLSARAAPPVPSPGSPADEVAASLNFTRARVRPIISHGAGYNEVLEDNMDSWPWLVSRGTAMRLWRAHDPVILTGLPDEMEGAVVLPMHKSGHSSFFFVEVDADVCVDVFLVYDFDSAEAVHTKWAENVREWYGYEALPGSAERMSWAYASSPETAWEVRAFVRRAQSGVRHHVGFQPQHMFAAVRRVPDSRCLPAAAGGVAGARIERGGQAVPASDIVPLRSGAVFTDLDAFRLDLPVDLQGAALRAPALDRAAPSSVHVNASAQACLSVYAVVPEDVRVDPVPLNEAAEVFSDPDAGWRRVPGGSLDTGVPALGTLGLAVYAREYVSNRNVTVFPRSSPLASLVVVRELPPGLCQFNQSADRVCQAAPRLDPDAARPAVDVNLMDLLVGQGGRCTHAQSTAQEGACTGWALVCAAYDPRPAIEVPQKGRHDSGAAPLKLWVNGERRFATERAISDCVAARDPRLRLKLGLQGGGLWGDGAWFGVHEVRAWSRALRPWEVADVQGAMLRAARGCSLCPAGESALSQCSAQHDTVCTRPWMWYHAVDFNHTARRWPDRGEGNQTGVVVSGHPFLQNGTIVSPYPGNLSAVLGRSGDDIDFGRLRTGNFTVCSFSRFSREHDSREIVTSGSDSCGFFLGHHGSNLGVAWVNDQWVSRTSGARNSHNNMVWKYTCVAVREKGYNVYTNGEEFWNGYSTQARCPNMMLAVTRGDRNAQNSPYYLADLRAWDRVLGKAEILALQEEEYERRLMHGDPDTVRDREQEDCLCKLGHFMSPGHGELWEWNPPMDRVWYLSQHCRNPPQLDSQDTLWCGTSNWGHWLEIDAVDMVHDGVEVAGLVTQGQYDANYWVKTLKLLVYNEVEQEWRWLRDEDGAELQFDANTDRNTRAHVVIPAHERRVGDRRFRIYPNAWQGAMRMRAGLLFAPAASSSPHAECAPCPVGTYKDEVGAWRHCRLCPSGTTTERAGAEHVDECVLQSAIACDDSLHFQSCPGFYEGWAHVRHLPGVPGGRWHRATDDALGDDVYGCAHLPDSEWSVQYNTSSVLHGNFTQMMFLTGKRDRWVVLERSRIYDQYSENHFRAVLRSSDSPASASKSRMYYRTNHAATPAEDPIICVGNCNWDRRLYLENHFNQNENQRSGGYDVYVRNFGSRCCQRCPDNTAVDVTRDVSRCVCAAGYVPAARQGEGPHSTCVPCPVGTFKAEVGDDTLCVPCAPGTSTGGHGGASECTPCRTSGYQPAQGAPECSACPSPGFEGTVQCPAPAERRAGYAAPLECLPPYQWYKAENFNGSHWFDEGLANYTAYPNAYSGGAELVLQGDPYARGAVLSVQGNSHDQLHLAKLPVQSDHYTICVLARYPTLAETARGPIFELDGSCSGYIGHPGLGLRPGNARLGNSDLAEPESCDAASVDCDRWAATCVVSAKDGDDLLYVDGLNRYETSSVHANCGKSDRLRINMHANTDWMVAEVRTWEFPLRGSDLARVQRDMVRANLGCSVCPAGEQETAPCSPLQDTQCTRPLLWFHALDFSAASGTWPDRGSRGAPVAVRQLAPAAIPALSSPSRWTHGCPVGAAQYEDMDDFEQMSTTGGGWSGHRSEYCGPAGQIKGRLGHNENPAKWFYSLPPHTELLIDVGVIIGDSSDWEYVWVQVDQEEYGERMRFAHSNYYDSPVNFCGNAYKESLFTQTIRVPHTSDRAYVQVLSNMNSGYTDEFWGLLYVNVRTAQCSTCDFGFAGASGPCRPCEPGSFKPQKGDSACVACPDGETSDSGAGSCRCADGQTELTDVVIWLPLDDMFVFSDRARGVALEPGNKYGNASEWTFPYQLHPFTSNTHPLHGGRSVAFRAGARLLHAAPLQWPRGGWSVCFWGRFNNHLWHQGTVLYYGEPDSLAGAVRVYISSNYVYFAVHADGAWVDSRTPFQVHGRAWRHLCWSVDAAGAWALHHDGVEQSLVGETELPSAMADPSRATFAVGDEVGPAEHDTGLLNAYLHDLRVYSRVITESEAAAMHGEGSLLCKAGASAAVPPSDTRAPRIESARVAVPNSTDWYGSPSTVAAVRGNALAGLSFGRVRNATGTGFSVCVVSRYGDAAEVRGRILRFSGCPGTLGPSFGVGGVASLGHARSAGGTCLQRAACDDWAASCVSLAPDGSMFAVENETVVEVTAAHECPSADVDLTLNQQGDLTNSDFEIAELRVWDTAKAMPALVGAAREMLDRVQRGDPQPKGVLGASSKSQCVCALGFQSDPASGACEACLPGTARGTPSAATCEACREGSVAPVEGTAACRACRAGTFSASAAEECSSCPAFNSACEPCQAEEWALGVCPVQGQDAGSAQAPADVFVLHSRYERQDAAGPARNDSVAWRSPTCERPYDWFVASDFNGTHWPNRGSSGRAGVVTLGAPSVLRSVDGHTHKAVPAVNGTRADKVDLGAFVDEGRGAWTVCHMSRFATNGYVGDIVGIGGDGCGAYLGHYGGVTGRVYVSAWLSPSSQGDWPKAKYDWTLTCVAWDHSRPGSPDYAYVDGQNRKTEYNAQASGNCGAGDKLLLNRNGNSDWQVAEVRVWNRQLEPGEIMQVSREMMEELLGKGCGPCEPGTIVTTRCTPTEDRTCDSKLRFDFRAEDFNTTSNAWRARYGDFEATIHRRPYKVLASGNGTLNSAVWAVGGYKDDQGSSDPHRIIFGSIGHYIWQACALVRYTGENRGRVIDMRHCDGAMGHHSQRVGRVYMSSTWVTDTGEGPTPYPQMFNWTSVCMQMSNSGEQLSVNGWRRLTAQISHNDCRDNDEFSINWGNTHEYSDFEIAQLSVWSGMHRTAEQVEDLERWMRWDRLRRGDAASAPAEAARSGLDSCTCAAGYAPKPGSAGECEPCPVGTYKDTTGALPCTLCPRNTYSRVVGATSMFTCRPCGDSSQSDFGSTECLCDDGFYGNADVACHVSDLTFTHDDSFSVAYDTFADIYLVGGGGGGGEGAGGGGGGGDVVCLQKVPIKKGVYRVNIGVGGAGGYIKAHPAYALGRVGQPTNLTRCAHCHHEGDHWTAADSNFNEGDQNKGTTTEYEKTLKNGVKVKLYGFRYTRTYAMGYLTNWWDAEPTMTVTGLDAGRRYEWRLFAYGNNRAYRTTRAVRVNGGEYVQYVQQMDLEKSSLRSTDREFVGVTGAPYSVARADGTILFEFHALKHGFNHTMSSHLHLTGLSIVEYTGPSATASSRDENARLMWVAAAGGGGGKNYKHHYDLNEDPGMGEALVLDGYDPYDARPVAVVNEHVHGLVSVGGGGGASGRVLRGEQEARFDFWTDDGYVPKPMPLSGQGASGNWFDTILGGGGGGGSDPNRHGLGRMSHVVTANRAGHGGHGELCTNLAFDEERRGGGGGGGKHGCHDGGDGTHGGGKGGRCTQHYANEGSDGFGGGGGGGGQINTAQGRGGNGGYGRARVFIYNNFVVPGPHCPPGQTAEAGACEPCPVHTYKDQYGNQACSPCPVPGLGTDTRTGLKQVTECKCALGHAYNATACHPCPRDTFVSPDGFSCTPCPRMTGSAEMTPSIHGCTACDAQPGATMNISGGRTDNGFSDNTGRGAQFWSPRKLCADDERVYVVDASVFAIRTMTWPDGVVTTLSGVPDERLTGGAEFRAGDGSAASARYYSPMSCVVDRSTGTVFLIDRHAVRALDPSDGSVQTLSGRVYEAGHVNGPANESRFSDPQDLALSKDGRWLFTIEHGSGDVVRRVDTRTGFVEHLSGSDAGYRDSDAEWSQFNNPDSIAVSPDGNFLYIGELSNRRLRKVFIETGESTTVAGTGGSGFADNVYTSASFRRLYDSVMVQDTLYFSDNEATLIRFFRPGTLEFGTLAGKDATKGFFDSTNSSEVRWYNPLGITASPDGLWLFISNDGESNNAIRAVRSLRSCCSEGFFSLRGACVQCPGIELLRTLQPAAAERCRAVAMQGLCGAGEEMLDGQCRACPAGTFKRGVGAGRCEPCRAGTVALRSGATECSVCPRNSFCTSATDVQQCRGDSKVDRKESREGSTLQSDCVCDAIDHRVGTTTADRFSAFGDAYAHYRAASVDLQNKTWYDLSGHGRHANLSGTVSHNVTCEAGHGSPVPYCAVLGQPSDTILFTHIPVQFTLCAISRLTDDRQWSRIFQGGEWSTTIFSHYRYNQRGIYYTTGRWSTDIPLKELPASFPSEKDWLVMCVAHNSSGSASVLAHGTNQTRHEVEKRELAFDGSRQLVVNNHGGLSASNERSHFAVSEVVVWDYGKSPEDLVETSAILQRRVRGEVGPDDDLFQCGPNSRVPDGGPRLFGRSACKCLPGYTTWEARDDYGASEDGPQGWRVLARGDKAETDPQKDAEWPGCAWVGMHSPWVHNQYLAKTFTGIPEHTLLSLEVGLVFKGTWDNEQVFASVDGDPAPFRPLGPYHHSGKVDLGCGDGYHHTAWINTTFVHNASELALEFWSNANEVQEGFAIKYVHVRSHECTECSAGYRWDGAGGKCVPCLPGTFSPAKTPGRSSAYGSGSGACQACPEDLDAPLPAARRCDRCKSDAFRGICCSGGVRSAVPLALADGGDPEALLSSNGIVIENREGVVLRAGVASPGVVEAVFTDASQVHRIHTQNPLSLTLYLVGGGGGACSYMCGGGGGGGVHVFEDVELGEGEHAVSVGAGGSNSPLRNGGSSAVGAYSVLGGCHGGTGSIKSGGLNCASGGGGDGNDGFAPGGIASCSPGCLANDGGDGSGSRGYGNNGGGGGGGAGGRGLAKQVSGHYCTRGGNGGPGVYLGDVVGDEYGEQGYFSGGGGGACHYNHGYRGYGGQGGGGGHQAGDAPTTHHAYPGLKNSGGGGSGAEGGSGLIVVQFKQKLVWETLPTCEECPPGGKAVLSVWSPLDDAEHALREDRSGNGVAWHARWGSTLFTLPPAVREDHPVYGPSAGRYSVELAGRTYLQTNLRAENAAPAVPSLYRRDFTVCMWFKMPSLSKQAGDYCLWAYGDSTQTDLHVSVTPSGSLKFSDASTSQEATHAGGDFRDESWHHVCWALKHSGATCDWEVTIDGAASEAASQAGADAPVAPPGAAGDRYMRLGNLAHTVNAHNSQDSAMVRLSDFRMFNRSLASGEVEAIHAAASAQSDSPSSFGCVWQGNVYSFAVPPVLSFADGGMVVENRPGVRMLPVVDRMRHRWPLLQRAAGFTWSGASGTPQPHLDSESGWISNTNNWGAWLTVDAGEEFAGETSKRVVGLAVQGRRTHTQFCRSIKVQSSPDNSAFTWIYEPGSTSVVYDMHANQNPSGAEFSDAVTNITFPEPRKGHRYFRVYCHYYYSHKVLRAGVLANEVAEEGVSSEFATLEFFDPARSHRVFFDGSTVASAMLVGGGGGGGGMVGGGGGAGGVMLTAQPYRFPRGVYSVNVGYGGRGGFGHDSMHNQIGQRGEETRLGEIRALGGGGGSGYSGYNNHHLQEIVGGSGGGGSRGVREGGRGYQRDLAHGVWLAYGSDGGENYGNGHTETGGGGGALSPGRDAVDAWGGQGGAGICPRDLFGMSAGEGGCFASGGSGAMWIGHGPVMRPPLGGGTVSADPDSSNAAPAAVPNTGGGGGAAGYQHGGNAYLSQMLGGHGGSGSVLIQVPCDRACQADVSAWTAAVNSGRKPDREGSIPGLGSANAEPVVSVDSEMNPPVVEPVGNAQPQPAPVLEQDAFAVDGVSVNASVRTVRVAGTSDEVAMLFTDPDIHYGVQLKEDQPCDILLVAGGGSGGPGLGGGGGAGTVVSVRQAVIPKGLYVFKVGRGGAPSRPGTPGVGNDGEATDAFGVHVPGGGGGGGNFQYTVSEARAGGSGGGATAKDAYMGGATTREHNCIPRDSPLYGNYLFYTCLGSRGGHAPVGADPGGAAGGGGATQPGGAPDQDGRNGGKGGDGFRTNILGQPYYFAGGGGGANTRDTMFPGNGGRGGGGGGSASSNSQHDYSQFVGMPGGGGIEYGLPGCKGSHCTLPGHAANNTGSGGGGGSGLYGFGGAGGHGIIILRFRNVQHEAARLDARMLTFTNPHQTYHLSVSKTIMANLFVVAGGGGGSSGAGGGGGGGGVLVANHVSIPPGKYELWVGDGGIGHDGQLTRVYGENGGSSGVFGAVVPGGGGGGCRWNENCYGADGGSGGGAQACSTSSLAPILGGDAVNASFGEILKPSPWVRFYGNKGGDAGKRTSGGARGGGGGGAKTAGIRGSGNAAGSNWNPDGGNSDAPGWGGEGITFRFRSRDLRWAGGGGGSAYHHHGGAGGAGGGGGGCAHHTSAPHNHHRSGAPGNAWPRP